LYCFAYVSETAERAGGCLFQIFDSSGHPDEVPFLLITKVYHHIQCARLPSAFEISVKLLYYLISYGAIHYSGKLSNILNTYFISL